MPGAHGVTTTGSLSAPGAFGEALVRFGRRVIAQKLRRAGEGSVGIARGLADGLGPSASGKRRRDKGVSYRNGFEATYTGLAEFEKGQMRFSLRNRSRHARIIEHGSRPHEIAPSNVSSLAWPGMKPKAGGKMTALPKGRAVQHPGTAAHHFSEEAVRMAMSQVVGGHATARITIHVRGRR